MSDSQEMKITAQVGGKGAVEVTSFASPKINPNPDFEEKTINGMRIIGVPNASTVYRTQDIEKIIEAEVKAMSEYLPENIMISVRRLQEHIVKCLKDA